jgi:phosphoribosyl-dephospho-CoA transferase
MVLLIASHPPRLQSYSLAGCSSARVGMTILINVQAIEIKTKSSGTELSDSVYRYYDIEVISSRNFLVLSRR